MAISDEIFVIALVCIINYLLIYRNSKIFGNIIFTLAGGFLAYQGGSSYVITGMGVLLIFIGLGNLLLDWANEN